MASTATSRLSSTPGFDWACGLQSWPSTLVQRTEHITWWDWSSSWLRQDSLSFSETIDLKALESDFGAFLNLANFNDLSSLLAWARFESDWYLFSKRVTTWFQLQFVFFSCWYSCHALLAVLIECTKWARRVWSSVAYLSSKAVNCESCRLQSLSHDPLNCLFLSYKSRISFNACLRLCVFSLSCILFSSSMFSIEYSLLSSMLDDSNGLRWLALFFGLIIGDPCDWLLFPNLCTTGWVGVSRNAVVSTQSTSLSELSHRSVLYAVVLHNWQLGWWGVLRSMGVEILRFASYRLITFSFTSCQIAMISQCGIFVWIEWKSKIVLMFAVSRTFLIF